MLFACMHSKDARVVENRGLTGEMYEFLGVLLNLCRLNVSTGILTCAVMTSHISFVWFKSNRHQCMF